MTSSSWAAHTSHIHRTLLASYPPPFLNTSSLPAPVIKCPGGLLIPWPSALALCSTLIFFFSFTLSPRYSSLFSCNKTKMTRLNRRNSCSLYSKFPPATPSSTTLLAVQGSIPSRSVRPGSSQARADRPCFRRPCLLMRDPVDPLSSCALESFTASSRSQILHVRAGFPLWGRPPAARKRQTSHAEQASNSPR